MKYKAGDIVKIKTWKEMKKEYGINSIGSIKCNCGFPKDMEEELNKNFPDRIVEIKERNEGNRHYQNYYKIENTEYAWSDDMIEGLSIDYKKPEPILSRFDILDIR